MSTVQEHIISLLETALSDIKRGDRIDTLDTLAMAQRAIRETLPKSEDYVLLRRHDLSPSDIARRCKFGSWRIDEFLDHDTLDAAGYTAERFVVELTDLCNRRLRKE